MTPNLFLLNASSLALICVLVLFARHNRKVGWVKQRATFVEDLRQLQTEWDAIDREIALARTAVVQPEAAKPVPMPPFPMGTTASGASGFASQLASLQTALKPSMPVTITEKVEDRETVTK